MQATIEKRSRSPKPAANAAKLERATFRTSRLLDFASEKELVAQIGHGTDVWPVVVLKELVDNALDACEEAGIAPCLQVVVDKNGITVTDNGPGVPAETIHGVLDFSVRISSREAYVAPTRGAQGNALKTLVAMPFVLDGTCGRIEVASRGIRHEIGMSVNRMRQEPRTSHQQRKDRNVKNGTSITVHWPSSACSILESAKSRFLQIASDFCWLNPHLALDLRWMGERSRINATQQTWRKWLPSTPTSAHWYEPEHLERLIAAYASLDAECGRERTVRELICEFAGLSGTAKQRQVLEETGLSRKGLADLVGEDRVDTNSIRALLSSMKTHTRAIKPQALGVIGRDHIEQRSREAGGEMASFTYRCVREDVRGLPQVTECAFVWRGDGAQNQRRLITGINWSPGILNPFRELGDEGWGLDGLLERQRAGGEEPIMVLIHVVCPRVQYTDRGKSAVVVDLIDENESEEMERE